MFHVYTAKELTIKGMLEKAHPTLVATFSEQMRVDTYLKRWVKATKTPDLHLGNPVMARWVAYYLPRQK